MSDPTPLRGLLPAHAEPQGQGRPPSQALRNRALHPAVPRGHEAADVHQVPLDAEPTTGGEWVLTYSAKEAKLRVTRWAAGELPGRRRYSNHFSTCAQADQHRTAR